MAYLTFDTPDITGKTQLVASQVVFPCPRSLSDEAGESHDIVVKHADYTGGKVVFEAPESCHVCGAELTVEEVADTFAAYNEAILSEISQADSVYVILDARHIAGADLAADGPFELHGPDGFIAAFEDLRAASNMREQISQAA